MSMPKKAGVSVLATVCGVARIVYSVRTLYSTDYTYLYTVVGLWSLGELTAGFLVIGVPAIPRRTRARKEGEEGGRGHHIASSDLPPWRRPSPTSRTTRDLWFVAENDDYNLLPFQARQAAHIEAGEDPSSHVELAKYTDIRGTQVDVIRQSRLSR
ncbi:hypothetical protein VMCG_10357 [Cytospora schulzeri]|uniref:Uncharacterized protein n=1 Tax=Cytospora schulzeri TaxID=448051 RepID=A0A423VFC8_9PEZI|nr:hypothetical protein VMCG_10357 [Valsa malicola]